MIFLVRGQKIMLSMHLAELYGVEPRVLIQAVKRNIERFPEDFMFQLSDEEFENLKSQIVISRPPPKNGLALTPKARTIWEAIPGNVQIKLLNKVWCFNCRKTTSIGGDVRGKVSKGMLVLRGRCTRCGKAVARVIENE